MIEWRFGFESTNVDQFVCLARHSSQECAAAADDDADEKTEGAEDQLEMFASRLSDKSSKVSK
jgi:hypothetical protein